MIDLNDSLPIGAMTIAELRQLLREELSATTTPTPQTNSSLPKRYVYGLRGIRELFGVSHLTAQRYKDGILAPAIKQQGRKIVVDADLAMELFNEKERNGRK